MDVTTAKTPPRSFSENSLVVSHDRRFAGRLQRMLEAETQCRVELASSYDEAERVVRQRLPQAVFVDLRESAVKQDPSSLLNYLGQSRQQRIPVIAISDSGYVCDWAATADLIIRGHISLPLDRRQIARLFETELAHRLFENSPGLTSPRTVRGRDVTIKTYTPEMSDLLDQLLTMAPHDVTILLVGETGTGKTTLAQLIHELSPRREQGLLTVACGTLPPMITSISKN